MRSGDLALQARLRTTPKGNAIFPLPLALCGSGACSAAGTTFPVRVAQSEQSHLFSVYTVTPKTKEYRGIKNSEQSVNETK